MLSRGLQLLSFATALLTVAAVQRPRLKDALHRGSERRKAPLFIELPGGGDARSYTVPKQYLNVTVPVMRTKKSRPQARRAHWRDSPTPAASRHEVVIQGSGLIDTDDATLAQLSQTPGTTGPPAVVMTTAAASAMTTPAVGAAAGAAPAAPAVAAASAPAVTTATTTAAPSTGGSILVKIIVIILLATLIGGAVALFLRWRAAQKQNSGRLAGAGAPDGTESQFWKSAKSRQSYRKSAINAQASDSEEDSKDSTGQDSRGLSGGDTAQGQSGTASRSAASYRDRRGRNKNSMDAVPPDADAKDDSTEKSPTAADGTGSRALPSRARRDRGGTESMTLGGAAANPSGRALRGGTESMALGAVGANSPSARALRGGTESLTLGAAGAGAERVTGRAASSRARGGPRAERGANAPPSQPEVDLDVAV